MASPDKLPRPERLDLLGDTPERATKDDDISKVVSDFKNRKMEKAVTKPAGVRFRREIVMVSTAMYQVHVNIRRPNGAT
jgi:hypothetical protein